MPIYALNAGFFIILAAFKVHTVSRILLIDDDNQVNEVMKATLEMLGHTVRTLDNADQVDEENAEFKPDMTLIDYMLPGRSGLEILRELNRTHPNSVRCLATGMADFNVLRHALDAGASSMLCKPYRLGDIVALLETAALLDAAVSLEGDARPPQGNVYSFAKKASEPVEGADLARLAAFARQCGADADTTSRRLPVIAAELMKNSARYGAVNYEVELRDEGKSLKLTVRDDGPGFDWAKVIARARYGMDKARAAGLQVVLALVKEIVHDDGGRTVRVTIDKESRSE